MFTLLGKFCLRPGGRKQLFLAALGLLLSGQAGITQTGIFQEVYSNLTGSAIANLTNVAAFPNSPSFTNVLSAFETAANSADNYGQRLRALIVAPTNGLYVFWVASDDYSVLYVSPDESPANKAQIAFLNGSTTSRNWTANASQQSSNVSLVAGQRYYIEVLHKEGTGSDNLAVRWRLPAGAIEEPIPGSRCRPFGVPASLAPTINQQPTNAVVVENSPVAFRLVLTNLDLVAYQWQRSGTNVPGALGATLTISNAALADNGVPFQCLLTNALGAVTSSVATLTVSADATAPALASAVNANSNTVLVGFSEPVEAASATNKLNYACDGGVTISNVAFAAGQTRVVQLTTSPLNFGTTYTLTVNNVRDRAGTPNTIAANSALPFPALLKGVYRELWTNAGGNFVIDLTTRPEFPASPQFAELITNVFETTNNMGDSYGQRLRARVIAPVTGSYTFWIAADENATLLLGTNDSAASARVIATSGAAPSRVFDSATNQRSAPVTLAAGQQYYFEALHKEGVLTDNLAVRWTLPDGSIEEPIPFVRLTPVGMTLPLITQQPANLTVFEGASAVFTVAEGNADPVALQWQRHGTNLAGATNLAYTNVSVALADNGATYRCLLSNPLGSTNSASATLMVSADTAPPMVDSVRNQGATNIVVFFTEPVEAATATNKLNYAIPGLAISGAALRPDLRSVLLTTAPLVIGNSYTGTVSNVRDRAAVPNVIPASSPFTLIAADFFPQDIGSPSFAGSFTSVPGGANITAGGLDIGGTNDQFNFGWQLRTGDFDVKVRVGRFDFSDTWAEAALLARESLAAGSRFAASVATPSLAGCSFAWRDTTNATALSSGMFTANPGNTWLRLARAGNVFTGFASFDGATWMQLGSVTSALTSTLYLGFAVASHNASATSTVEFRDFMTVTNAVLGTLALNTEPPGPCSRRTPLAITEIMYHPAERADGRSTEFVEVFNSNPFPEEIGGFRLSGDISYSFPPGTFIRGGEFLVVARDPADFQAAYSNFAGVVFGPYDNNLPNTAGTLRLRNELDAVLIEIDYDSRHAWPAAADGAGHSLVLARPTWGEGNVKAWGQSDVIGGSPGTADGVRFEPQRNVLINEFLANTDPPALDYIELHNHSPSAVDLSGCWLSDDPATNKFRIPPGTVIGPTGFVFFTGTTLGFSLSSAGEAIYFVNSNQTRVLDAARFEGQESGVSMGRIPDGAPGFSRCAITTPGAPNGSPRPDPIVINEIMYSPVSGNAADPFVELYNRGITPVSLGGWRFTDGIDFTFPTNAVIPADGCVVVAGSATNLLARYTNLTAANCFGNFSGSLKKSGERVAISFPGLSISTNALGQPQTNVFYIAMDEVTYGAGGRWGQWSDGGGSSLELIDPRADNRLPSSWADSDDTAKSVWTTINVTSSLTNGGSSMPSNSLQVWMQDAGEALLDDVSVSIAGSANLVSNGGFESGMTDWFAQGNYIRTSLESTGYLSAGSLHLRGTARGDTGANRVRTTLTSTYSNMVAGTIAARMKWLHGKPEALLRLRGNHLEAPVTLLVPPNLGSPGAHNSRFATNAGPAIVEVLHAPILPAANQPIVVTARVGDPDGLGSVQLLWRVDGGGATNTASMLDDGTGGDAVAGDGGFAATIPGQASGVMIAFQVRATDAGVVPVTTRFPDNAPAREALVRVGETIPNLTYGSYRAWLTQSNFNRWVALTEKLSNEPYDATFVVGNFRVIYGAAARYAGSPFHSPGFNSPTGNNCDYQITLPPDDMHLAEIDFTLQLPGNGGGDSTTQGQQAAYWMSRKLGAPFSYHRFVNMYMQGVKRGTIMEDVQQPNGDHERQWFPDADDGDLYKVQFWFEFNDNSFSPFSNAGASLARFTGADGGRYLPRYRQNFGKRAGQDSTSNYTNLFALVEALNTSATGEAYLAAVWPLVDFQELARVFAVERVINNTDVWGNGGGQNFYIYKAGSAGKWNGLLWDIDFAFVNGTPTANLFNFTDTPITTLFNHPLMRRIYWQALEDAAHSSLLPANLHPLLDAKYDAMRASGLNPSAPTSIKTFAQVRRDYILSLLSTVRAGLTISNNAGADFTNGSTVVTLNGPAPIAARALLVNGVAWPITWSTITNWSITLTLGSQSNSFNVQGVDANGVVLPGGSRTMTVYFAAPVARPEEALIINEIMFNPAVSNASYVELFNRSTNTAFALGQYRLKGIDFDFSLGTILQPRGHLLVVRDTNALLAAHPSVTNSLIAGVFSGTLDPDGETLTLVRNVGTNEFVIDKVKYEAAAPWPATAAGASAQLIDAAQDNARASNWSDGAGWRFFSYTGVPNASRLLLFLDGAGEVDLDDISLVPGSVPGAGTNLIRNGGFDAPISAGWGFLGTSATNSVVTESHAHSGGSALRLVFTAPGSPTACFYQDVSNMVASSTHTLSFWYYATTSATNLTARFSSLFRPLLSVRSSGPTPGVSNSVSGTVAAYPPLWINEVAPNNPSGYADNTGAPQPWLELLNSGTNLLALDGFSLAGGFTDVSSWSFPTGAVLAPGEFRVVFADGQPGLSTGTVLHTSFRLEPTNGAVVLSRGGQVLDYVRYAGMQPGLSYGSAPDGQLFDRQTFFFTTPGGSNNAAPIPVAINEWMASNLGTIPNPANARYDDWFELYNFGNSAIDLSGYFLTDDLGARRKFRIPEGTSIGPHGFLFVWADNDATGTNTTGGALHANFQLGKSGDEIGFFSPDGLLVDAVSFGAQTTDVSHGRYPDGNTLGLAQAMTMPTPGASNLIGGNLFNPVLAAIPSLFIDEGVTLRFTNSATDADLPAQTLSFALLAGAPFGAAVDAGSGVFTWTPVEQQGGASYPMTVRVSDNGQPERTDTKSFMVTVNKVNRPPAITAPPPQTVDEDALFSLAIVAEDHDLLPQSLSYLLSSPPPGASIDATGLITWTPSETQGPATNLLAVVVTDNGLPPMSATQLVSILVREVNAPPGLAAPPSRTVHQGATVAFTNYVTDPDFPPNLFTFSLGNAPAGATVNAAGVFSWTPGLAVIDTTNTVLLTVTDNGLPPLADSRSFTIAVRARPHIESITLTNATVTLVWTAIPGTTYRVQQKSLLDAAGWTDLPGDVTAAGPSTSVVDSRPASGQRFYRIEVK